MQNITRKKNIELFFEVIKENTTFDVYKITHCEILFKPNLKKKQPNSIYRIEEIKKIQH